MISLDKLINVAKDKATIPLGMAIIIGYIIVWAVHAGDDLVAHAMKISNMEMNQAAYNKTMQVIDKRLSRIEWALKIKPDRGHRDDEE